MQAQIIKLELLNDKIEESEEDMDQIEPTTRVLILSRNGLCGQHSP